MPSNTQSIADSVVRLAIEQAESIKQLPRQIEESFSTGAPAEERAKSIGSACIAIQFELGPVTNYIERNAPHLYQKHLRRLLSILDLAKKCAAYDIPEYSKPSIRIKRASPGARATAKLFVVATKFAESLCEWAEELEAAVRERTGEPVRAGTRGGKGKRRRLGRKSKRRGRKAIDPAGDKKVMEAWETDNYKTYAELANEKGISAREVQLALGRVRFQRRSNSRR